MDDGHCLVDEDVARNKFPMGMRVLAVDDNQFSLKMLEDLLRKCNYHVMTTTLATKALEMLMENKNNFDLLITKVDMPLMDGFKLLEEVEPMGLPVIMLSSHYDKEWVKKSVIHGACYNLTKPVRIEELKNIWQHVLRKKIDWKERNKAAIEKKICNMVKEDGQVMASENNADQNKKVCQKRKGKSEEIEENGQKNKGHSRKKPRLVWTNELHAKFVGAFNQLRLDQAYPKSILELMSVKGLTREQVASHLQKYKLSLRQHSTRQANMVAAIDKCIDPYPHHVKAMPFHYANYGLEDFIMDTIGFYR